MLNVLAAANVVTDQTIHSRNDHNVDAKLYHHRSFSLSCSMVMFHSVA